MPADDYDIGHLAELTWGVVDGYGIDRPVLMGHSWGGAICCYATVQQPDRVAALVLVDSGHLDWGEADPDLAVLTFDQMVQRTEGLRWRSADLDAVATELEVAADDPLVEAFAVGLMDDGDGGLISITTGESRGAAGVSRGAVEADRDVGHDRRARRADAPAARHGPRRPPELNEGAVARFRAALPNAEIDLVEGASHSMITDLRERFGTRVLEWLNRLGA